MSRKADALRIGLFVLGGVALAVVGATLLGGGFLFEDRHDQVSFFSESTDGLSVGSQVTFRGVKIGEVTAVRVELDLKQFAAKIPVYYYVDRRKVRFFGGKSADVSTQELIHRGLRAKLVSESFITGQKSIALDFQPDIPPIFIGEPARLTVPEIPVVPSEFESVKKRLEGLPIEELAQSTLKMVHDIDAVVASPELKTMMASLAGASNEIELATHDDLGPALKSLHTLLDEVTATAITLRATLDEVRANLGGTAKEIQGTAAAATRAIESDQPALHALLEHSDQAVVQATSSLAAVSSMIGPDRPMRADLDQLMRELTLTSRALRDLSDELRRNPNLLITGKK